MNILSIHLLTKEIHKLKEFYSDLGFKTEIMENKLIVHLIKSDIIFENDITKKCQ